MVKSMEHIVVICYFRECFFIRCFFVWEKRLSLKYLNLCSQNIWWKLLPCVHTKHKANFYIYTITHKVDAMHISLHLKINNLSKDLGLPATETQETLEGRVGGRTWASWRIDNQTLFCPELITSRRRTQCLHLWPVLTTIQGVSASSMHRGMWSFLVPINIL